VAERETDGVALARARAALEGNDWEKARDAFRLALAAEESPEALLGLASASWWLDDGDTTLDARERAYKLLRDRGENRVAAMTAIWLADDYFKFRGEPAVAKGWRQRAHRLLDGAGPCAEQGWLAMFEGSWALEMDDDLDAARRLAAEAVELGRRFAVLDLEMLALAVEGLALVSEGRVADGMQRLDEATTAGIAGELEPFAIGWAYCYLVIACERVRDYDRAAQWCDRMAEVSQRLRFRLWMGACRARHAAILTWRGEWAEAEQELRGASEQLAASRPPAVGEGLVRLGDLRRRQGRLDEARGLFNRAGSHPLALLGLAETELDHGDAREADAIVERLLRQLSPTNRTLRAPALEVVVRTKAALGQLDSAVRALDELRRTAEAVGTDPLRAGTRFCEGVVAAAHHDSDRARACFEDAAGLFERAGAPFEVARARLELATALAALDRKDAARRSAESARESFEAIGAAREAERAASFLEKLDGLGKERSILSPREVEILRLIADGRNDKEIASAVSLSEHTIHRHVSNVLTKLAVRSRAAAVASAARQGIL
jgi:LuxR family maltose regulon positive regulatory protein